MSTYEGIFKKNIDSPDVTRTMPKTKVDIVNFGEYGSLMKLVYEPGFQWSKDVRPNLDIGGSFQDNPPPHISYVISGRAISVSPDGSKSEQGPGDVTLIPPFQGAERDLLVVGNEPFIAISFIPGDIFNLSDQGQAFGSSTDAVEAFGASAQSKTASPTTIDGKWRITIGWLARKFNMEMDISSSGDTFVGTMKGAPLLTEPARIVDGRIDGKNMAWTIKVTMVGGEIQVQFSATMKDNQLSGKADAGRLGKFSFKGVHL